jgi:hypothetical protein
VDEGSQYQFVGCIISDKETRMTQQQTKSAAGVLTRPETHGAMCDFVGLRPSSVRKSIVLSGVSGFPRSGRDQRNGTAHDLRAQASAIAELLQQRTASEYAGLEEKK